MHQSDSRTRLLSVACHAALVDGELQGNCHEMNAISFNDCQLNLHALVPKGNCQAKLHALVFKANCQLKSI